MSSIYQDPTLGVSHNFHLVLTRLVFLHHKNESQIIEGNAKVSLESVNRWNSLYLNSLVKGGVQTHDLAVWLTRCDIGGPSGYAPLSGTCDPKRSCTLNKDEGLTSAFVIAHEIGHM